jgi:hypothetical protein
MPKSTGLLKKLNRTANRIETMAGKTGVNVFKYIDKAWVSPNIPYHIYYMPDGREIYATEMEFNEFKSEVIVRFKGETDYKRYQKTLPMGDRYVPVGHKPSAKKSDIKKGFMERCFVKPASTENALVTEVDPAGFKGIPDTYKKIKIRWQIKGRRSDVSSKNINQIQKADRIVPGVSELPISALDEYRISREEEKKYLLEKKLERMNKY